MGVVVGSLFAEVISVESNGLQSANHLRHVSRLSCIQWLAFMEYLLPETKSFEPNKTDEKHNLKKPASCFFSVLFGPLVCYVP